jgi:hypothetical protein
MSLFDDASLVYIPTGYKPTKNYSGKPSTGGADMTFSRASGATRVNSRGLVEKVRTNLALYSEDFTNAAWANINSATVTGDTTTAPNGTTTADTITAGGGSSTSRVRQSFAFVAGAEYAISIYVKANDSLEGRLATLNSGGTTRSSVTFSNTAGVVAIVGSTGGGTTDIESVGSGWYRISHQIVINDQSTLDFFADRNGTNLSWYTWGAMIETGVLTPYIGPTLGTGVSVGPVANVPRLDYSGGASCPRLLLEPQRTNLVQYSESFNTSSSWSLSRTSAFGSGSVANAVTSPDGYTNAEYIQQATGETDGGGCFQGISYTSGASYTLSVFAKQGENRYARIGFGIGSGGAGIFCGFDLQDGIAGTPGTGITAKIENYGNGWYRCSVTATAQITGARNTFVYQSSNLNTFVTTPLQGIYVWGAQLEESYYETSYIPTLGAAVTRLADASFKTGIGSLLSASEYTLYWEGTHIPTGQYNSFMTIYKASDLNSSARFYRNNTNNEIRAAIFDSVSGLSLDLGSGVTTQTAKCAIRVKAGSYALYVNGALVNSNTNALAPSSNLDAVNLQYFDSSQSFDQKTGQVLFFKTALSNATLATLTSL